MLRVAAVALLFVARPALPCSPPDGASTGIVNARSGPRPLLALPEAAVLWSAGREVGLVEAAAPTGLENSAGAYGEPLSWFSPEQDLPIGFYSILNETFEVVSSPTSPMSLPVGIVTERRIAEGNPGGGCGPFGSCGPMSSVQARFPAGGSDPTESRFLVRFRSGSRSFSRLVSDPSGQGGAFALRFIGLMPDADLRTDDLCLSVASVSAEGEVGPEQDLGCPAATEAGGCRGAPRSIPTLGLLVLLVMAHRLRNRWELT